MYVTCHHVIITVLSRVCHVMSCAHYCCVQLLQRRSEELEKVRSEGKGQMEHLQTQNKQLEKTSRLQNGMIVYIYLQPCEHYMSVFSCRPSRSTGRTEDRGGKEGACLQPTFPPIPGETPATR